MASSNTVANVTLTKCQKKRHVGIFLIQQKCHLTFNNLLVWSQIQSTVFKFQYRLWLLHRSQFFRSQFSRFYTNSNKSFFTKITFLFYWFIKLSHWQNYLKNNIVLLKWVNFYHIYKKIWPGSQCDTLSCLMSYIICLLCKDMLWTSL